MSILRQIAQLGQPILGQVAGWGGGLSIPGLRGLVPRHWRSQVRRPRKNRKEKVQREGAGLALGPLFPK